MSTSPYIADRPRSLLLDALGLSLSEREAYAPTLSVMSGERRLAYEALTLAIHDAQIDKPDFKGENHSVSARAWLRGCEAELPAEVCSALLNINHEAMLSRLEYCWKNGITIVLPRLDSGSRVEEMEVCE